MGHDLIRKGQCADDILVGMTGLGNQVRPYGYNSVPVRDNRTFLMRPGSWARFALPEGMPTQSCQIFLRCGMHAVRSLTLEVSADGTPAGEITLTENAPGGMLSFSNLRMVHLPFSALTSCSEIEISVKACELEDETPTFVLDGLLLTSVTDPALAAARFHLHEKTSTWKVHREPASCGVWFSTDTNPVQVALYSEDERARPPAPYSDCTIPHVFSSDLTMRPVLRRLSNDSLTNWYGENIKITGDGKDHYAGYALSPIVVAPHHARVVYLAMVCGNLNGALEKAASVYAQREEIETCIRAHYQQTAPHFPECEFSFSQQRQMAQIFTTAVYPLRRGDQYVKAYVPGKRFSALFTWDSGFYGIGWNEYSSQRAIEIADMFIADADDEQNSMLLGGTPLPLQVYLMAEIAQRSGDFSFLQGYYPRLRRYQRFISGQDPTAPFDMFKSGLLNPFLEGYNSFGVDDYPPQHYAGSRGWYDRISPVSNTAHAIRITKLVQLFACALGKPDSEIEDMQNWIDYLSASLQSYSWDEESGYYSYVLNEGKRKLLYDDERTNFNMGLDGISPLIAGICTPDQHRRLVEHIMTPGELWSPSGIVSVSQAAPYARNDGYWNGKVWMPHQWFIWKAMISRGEMEHAERIAQTALRVWKNASDETYNNYEQFDGATGQGEGCHHFPGLSAPIAAFFHRYYTPGRLTAGYDTLIHTCKFDPDRNRLQAILSAPLNPGKTGLVVVMARPGRYRIQLGERTWTQISPSGWLNLVVDLQSKPEELVVEPILPSATKPIQNKA